MPVKNPHFWFSFAVKEGNVGVLLIKDECKNPGTEEACEMAMAKAKELAIVPDFAHIKAFSTEGLESGMVANKFYTAEDMRAMDYKSDKEQKHS